MATVAPSYAVRPAAPARGRLDSIDLLRGIVMVVMVIDHTRDFVHAPAFRYDPTDLAHASAAVFMTRWITHFCAPVFVFLAGVSAYLQKMRGKSVSDLSRFLVTRGIWLIAVEVVVLHLLVWFSVDFISFVGIMQVIWAIGWSMCVLAALVYLPLRATAVFGVGMIVLHNTLDSVQVAAWNGPGSPIPSAAGKLWMVLHQAGLTPILGAGSPLVMIQYPLIPWVGVMAAGYAFGSLYELDRDRRISIIRRLGMAAMAAFVVIRATNLYGDPSPWTLQPTLLFTILSFINTTKYPPSLLYLLMTLGPSLVALAWFESRERRTGPAPLPVSERRGPVAALVTVGRVPLFFYLWQWVLAHSAAIVANIVVGRSFAYLFLMPPALFAAMARNGFRLWAVYLCWACIIAVEYPLCLWFAGVKRRRRDWWLSYL
jgi:uncharacterized membrane protein